MATLTLRQIKGLPLTNAELDNNFSNLDNEKVKLGGDLGGSTSTPAVVKLQGFAVSNASPVSGQTLIWNGTAWAPQQITLSGVSTVVNTVVDDITYRLNSINQVFTLKVNGSVLSGTEYTDNKDLEVVLNGFTLTPFITHTNRLWPWMSEFDAGRSNSFRMRGAKIIFYNQPRLRNTVFIKINTKSASRQVTKYPLQPINIAFGD